MDKSEFFKLPDPTLSNPPKKGRSHSRFRASYGGTTEFQGSGVYECRDCGKRTRKTGDGESSVRM